MSDPEGGPDIQFQAHLRDGRFMIQRGIKTGRAVFFPRAVAPETGEELEWVEASGRGTVYSATVVHRRPPEADTSIVLVDLEEGPRMMSNVVGVAPADVQIGMALQACIVPYEEGHKVVFTPATGTEA